METTFRRISTTCLTCLVALGLAACITRDSGSDDGTETDSSGTGDGSGDDGGTDDGGTGSDDGGTGDGGGDDGTTGGDDGGTTDDGSSAPPEPLPNGSPCTNNDDCESGFCYSTAMGSVCSECLVDADCGEGTCAIDIDAGYAVCTDGSLGMGCDSDEGCAGDLVCAELIDTQGYFPANFCSECKTTADCDGTAICSPHFDAGAFSGYMECVEPGTVPNDQGCPVDDSGVGDDSVCESGYCGIADVGGVVQIGLCGECDPDTGDGCPGSETCNPPTADMSGISGAYCNGGGGTGTGTGTGSAW
jgi:hypothetical protein